MGFGTTFATLAFLFIFAGMSVIVIGMQDAITASATEIREQQQEIYDAQQQEIDITNSTYQENKTLDWIVTYNDEFDKGEYENTTSASDAVQLQNETNGIYTSNAYETGHTSNYTTISWSSLEPSGSSITLQLRSADTLTNLQAQTFVGPDGTSTTNYQTPGTAISSVHQGDKIIQYRATLQTSLETPQLQETQIGIQRDVGHITLTIQNTGSQKLYPQQTDAYIDGIRWQRTPSQRVIELENTIDERLWNAGEELHITLFENVTSNRIVTIINDNAQAQTQVSN